MAPKPQGTLSLSLACIEGFSHSNGPLLSIESYLLQPFYMPTHKPINLLHQISPSKLLTIYNDGSVCLWDVMNAKPLSYFRTELENIKYVVVDGKMAMVMVGFDRMKREVINVVVDN